MTIKRYNSGIQRAKGFLELAAALYDSSLSSESWKAAEGVLQTDALLGNALRLSLTAKSDDRKGISLLLRHGELCGDQGSGRSKVSLAWVIFWRRGPWRTAARVRSVGVCPCGRSRYFPPTT